MTQNETLWRPCRGGRCRIPGLTYASKRPGVAPRLKWRADCQAALTCAELALALRAFDAAVAWDALRRPPDDGRCQIRQCHGWPRFSGFASGSAVGQDATVAPWYCGQVGQLAGVHEGQLQK